jgi:hypothetical protein
MQSFILEFLPPPLTPPPLAQILSSASYSRILLADFLPLIWDNKVCTICKIIILYILIFKLCLANVKQKYIEINFSMTVKWCVNRRKTFMWSGSISQYLWPLVWWGFRKTFHKTPTRYFQFESGIHNFKILKFSAKRKMQIGQVPVRVSVVFGCFLYADLKIRVVWRCV